MWVEVGSETREGPIVSHGKKFVDTAGHAAYIILYLLLIIFFFLFYDSANLAILLYVGWGTLVLGIAFLFSASNSRKKARTSKEEDASRPVLVESGMYAFVRNPEFLGHILIIFSLVFIAQKWFSIIIGAALIALLWVAIVEEEKSDLEKFGDAYEDYMRRVPRIDLLAGIIRQRRRKRKMQA
jgi:protein-S-isoprenylcysteine O-methyltransferase Ste14